MVSAEKHHWSAPHSSTSSSSSLFSQVPHARSIYRIFFVAHLNAAAPTNFIIIRYQHEIFLIPFVSHVTTAPPSRVHMGWCSRGGALRWSWRDQQMAGWRIYIFICRISVTGTQAGMISQRGPPGNWRQRQPGRYFHSCNKREMKVMAHYSRAWERIERVQDTWS